MLNKPEELELVLFTKHTILFKTKIVIKSWKSDPEDSDSSEKFVDFSP